MGLIFEGGLQNEDGDPKEKLHCISYIRLLRKYNDAFNLHLINSPKIVSQLRANGRKIFMRIDITISFAIMTSRHHLDVY